MIEPVLSDEAFLMDVDRSARQPGLHLWWLGQSGFLLAWEGRRLLLDPYLSDSLTAKYAGTDKPHVRMTRRVVAPNDLREIDVVTSTHNHTDHLDADTLRPLLQVNPAMRIVVSAANVAFAAQRLGVPESRLTGLTVDETWSIGGLVFRDDHPATTIDITAVPAAHDEVERDDVGRHRYVGYVIRCGPWTVYHAGDTVLYKGMTEQLSFNVDVAILPINGKIGNMGGRDAARLAKDIGAKLVIPCHYEMFEFNTADPRDEFIPECERLGQPYKVLRAGERLTLGA